MRIKFLQHVPFENAANIANWSKARGHSISGIRLFAGEPLCAVDDFDMLAVMGGPMGVYDVAKFGWLADEKRFIADAIEKGKSVIGVCLGAQLIADVLGAKVFKGREPEIGWHKVSLSANGRESGAFAGMEEDFTVFQWHCDTFHIPDSCRLLAMSEACRNQAFDYDDGRVLALQFHLETSQASMDALIENCADELKTAPYIQSAERMREIATQNLPAIETKMNIMLDSVGATLR